MTEAEIASLAEARFNRTCDRLQQKPPRPPKQILVGDGNEKGKGLVWIGWDWGPGEVLLVTYDYWHRPDGRVRLRVHDFCI